MSNTRNPLKNCRRCGDLFHTSRTGYTTNCPRCRETARTTERLTGDAWAAAEMRRYAERYAAAGRADGEAGRPRAERALRATEPLREAYTRAYEAATRRREETR